VASTAEKSAPVGMGTIDVGGNTARSVNLISDVASGRLAGAHAKAHRHAVDQLFGSDDFEVLYSSDDFEVLS
jgi:hypothetical protein